MEHQQSGGLRQRLLLEGQFARPGADTLLILAPRGPRDPIGYHGIGLHTGRPPGLYLLRVETLRPAVGAQRRGIQRAPRQHHGELLGAAALPRTARRRCRRGIGLHGQGAPTVEGVLGDPRLLRQLAHRAALRGQHLGNEAGFELG